MQGYIEELRMYNYLKAGEYFSVDMNLNRSLGPDLTNDKKVFPICWKTTVCP